MKTISLLSLRILSRTIDRSTGSPLSRWLLTALLLLLPVVILATSPSNPLGTASSFATVANLLLIPPTVGLVFMAMIAILWRVDGRFLELFEASPMTSSRWQFALLAPVIALVGWVAIAVSMPMVRDVLVSPDLSLGTTVGVLLAWLLAMGVGVVGGMVLGLVVRLGLARLPRTWRSFGRSVAVVAVAAVFVWTAFRLLSSVNDRIVQASIAQITGEGVGGAEVQPFSVTLVAGMVAGASFVVLLLLSFLALNLRFTSVESPYHLAPLPIGPLITATPAGLGRSWLRSPPVASQFGLALLVVLAGLAIPDVRWLVHAGIILAAAGFVGYASGSVGMRSIVQVGAVSRWRWFLRNGSGAVATWLTILTAWCAVMLLMDEQVFETAVAASLVMAIALFTGGAFAYSYGSSLGAELANLVVYGSAAAVVFFLVERDIFGAPRSLLVASTSAALFISLLAYAWQCVGDTRAEASR